MSTDRNEWRPTANRTMLERRAKALACVREFFAVRGVMEVDTPMVVNAPVTDVHIHSAEVRFALNDTPTAPPNQAPYYLHTSPEFAMKRLLASGSGDIYQTCHVVRALERGRQHNAEFTLIEWYRLDYSLENLMEEVEALARAVLGEVAPHWKSERVCYEEAIERALHLNPFTASLEDLRAAAREAGFDASSESQDAAERDELLELLMGTYVGPRLGREALTFVHRYPASQAALARLDPNDSRCALRFELYCQGMELANGFHELAAATEQRARFEQDLAERHRRGLVASGMDTRLLGALEHGFPDCAGVAVGFDRLLMLATGVDHIDQVMPFPIERA